MSNYEKSPTIDCGNESHASGSTILEPCRPPQTGAPSNPPGNIIQSNSADEKSKGPPNGGLVAWTQVLCGFMLFFNTFGLLTSFGVFQTYYESEAIFNHSSSDISWIGSVQAFLVQFCGLISGPVYDRGYLRSLLCAGCFLLVFGHMMLSLANTYWQIILSQGICIGIGMGCLYVPSISILPSYFSTRLGLAIGVASSGSSLGGVIYPIVMHRLLENIGFPWAVRVMGFIALATMTIPISLMRIRLKPAKARALIDPAAFTDWPYIWFTVATMIGFMGITAFQFYFSFYAKANKLTSSDLAFDLVPIYNAVSAIGRIVPNAISDKTGLFNILAPGVLLTGVVYYCSMAVHEKGPMIGVTILGGFFLGLLTALPPVCFAALVKDKSKIGTRIGMGTATIAFGLLVGGPGAGGILRGQEPLNWSGLWSFAGTAMVISGIMYVLLRIHRSGFKLLVKA